ncbi:MAG TPA: hypothetical protein VFA26_15265 [Gemmataceae bacterium]|nr:hypothetical protein [Gemmataceae bacterium]
MFRKSAFALAAACTACLLPLIAAEPEAAPASSQPTPAYRVLLRSRSGAVAPEHLGDAQTGSGHIDILQREPNELVALMRGAVVAGTDQRNGGSAAMRFVLEQEFEVIPTRTGLRPPMLTVVGQVIGSLQSTAKGNAAAEQGPACAAVNLGGQPVVHFCLKPHNVSGGQNLFVTDRIGPLEAVIVPGPYCLHQTFEVSASEPHTLCAHLGTGAAADFDPDPRLDARWNRVLRPFRAVPHRDFGFGVLVRVVEAPAGAVPRSDGSERLPPPRPADKDGEAKMP